MIRAWRITDEKYARRAFDGEGARRYGGRWNHKGSSAVYTSDSLALAALEQLVHLSAEIPLSPRVAISVDIPTDLAITVISPSELPEGWRRTDGVEALKERGTRWLDAGETAVLSVPSVIVPKELNYVLNPEHPDFGRIEIGGPEVFEFDPRLLS